VCVLKGVKDEYKERLIQKRMSDFGITQFKDVQAGKLSGGNKRKLSAAMAMVGAPAIIFLDEQSAGVDPASRKKMWRAIQAQTQYSAIIVTTHSMEEAEALGTKIAIMVKGKFRCFGTAQHLKDKFGKGYEIKLKIDMDKLNFGGQVINADDDAAEKEGESKKL